MFNSLARLQASEQATFTKRFGITLPDPFVYKYKIKDKVVFALAVYGPIVIIFLITRWSQQQFGLQSSATVWIAMGCVGGYGILASILMSKFSKHITNKSKPNGNVVLDFINEREPNTQLTLQQTDHAFTVGAVSIGYQIKGHYHGQTINYIQHSQASARSGITTSHLSVDGHKKKFLNGCYTLQGMILRIDEAARRT